MLRCLCLGLVMGATHLSSSAAEPGSPAHASLQKKVTTWVAQNQSVSPDAVTVAPLDPRLQVRSCAQPLAFDLPFASAQTVRVRCAQPVWQLYVRVEVKGGGVGKVASSTANPATAPAPLTRQILVAALPLQRGMTLNAAHVRVAEVEVQGLPVNVLEQASQVLHAEVVRDVRADTPLRSQDIRPTVLVKRGQMVLLSMAQSAGFQITARVEAMQDGRYGEQIKLKNRESGRLLSGLVKGPNQVEAL